MKNENVWRRNNEGEKERGAHWRSSRQVMRNLSLSRVLTESVK